MYDGIIFDKDGVLLDSAVNNFRWMDDVRRSTARKLGVELSSEESTKIAKASSSSEVEKILNSKNFSWKELQEIEHTVQDSKIQLMQEKYITPFPEVDTILENLRVEKAVATNAPRRTTDFTLDHFGLEGYFRKVSAPELEPIEDYFDIRKPRPYMLETVLDYMKAENPVMVGDSKADIKAADNAGIDSILIESYGERPELNPTYRVARLAELKKFI